MEPVTLLYYPITLSLKVLNTLLAPSLIGLGTWFINQSYYLLSLPLTCGRLLLISCCSNISISCELGFLGFLSSIGFPSLSWWRWWRRSGRPWWSGSWSWWRIILKQSNQFSFSHTRIISQSTLSSERFQFKHSHIFILHFNRGIKSLIFFPIKMVTLKEYEPYLKVKRFIDGHDESEIISRLMGDNKYISLIIKSDDADPIKYYSTSAAARHCGVTKQTLD